MVDPRRKHDPVRMLSRSPLIISKTRPALWLAPTSVRSQTGARTFYTDQRFVTSNGLALNTGDFFVDFWVRKTVAGGQYVLYAGGGSAAGLNILYQSSGKISANAAAASTHATFVEDATALGLNTWAYYCVICDRTARTLKLYKNGSPIAVGSANISASYDGESFAYASAINIGGLTDGTRGMELACLGIGLGAKLTDAEMLERYNSGARLLYDDISDTPKAKYTYHWNLNETSGNALSQVGSKDGTATSSPGFAAGPGLPAIPADGSVCGYVTSRDASGIALSQATPAVMPTVDVDGVGENALAFSGSQYLTASSVPIDGETFDSITTFKTGAAAFSADQYLWSFSDISAANVYGGLGIDSVGRLFVETYDGTTKNRLVGSTFLDVDSVYSVQVTNSGSAVAVQIVGVPDAETLTAANGSNDGTWAADMTGVDTLTVGGLRTSGGNVLFAGSISDVRLYNTQQSSSMMRAMRGRVASSLVSTLVVPMIVFSNDATLSSAGAQTYQTAGPVYWYDYIDATEGYDTSHISEAIVDTRIASWGSDPRPYIMDIEEFKLYPYTYTTGTIAYDHTGGSDERLVTLTGASWHGSAALGTLTITGYGTYDIATRIDDHHITLAADSNPGGDVAGGTTYSFYLDDRDYAVTQLRFAKNKWKDTARRIGFYGIIPEQSGKYWAYASYYGGSPSAAQIAAFRAVQAINDENAQDIGLDGLDFVCPSVYEFYGEESSSYGTWEAYATGLIDEAHRVSGGKPVYPFIWPTYHPSATGAGGAVLTGEDRAIPAAIFESRIDFMKANTKVRGVIIWQEAGDPVDANWRDGVLKVLNQYEAPAP